MAPMAPKKPPLIRKKENSQDQAANAQGDENIHIGVKWRGQSGPHEARPAPKMPANSFEKSEPGQMESRHMKNHKNHKGAVIPN